MWMESMCAWHSWAFYKCFECKFFSIPNSFWQFSSNSFMKDYLKFHKMLKKICIYIMLFLLSFRVFVSLLLSEIRIQCRYNHWNPSVLTLKQCIRFLRSDRSRLMSPQLACRHTQSINSRPVLSLPSRPLLSLTLHFPPQLPRSEQPTSALTHARTRSLSHSLQK